MTDVQVDTGALRTGAARVAAVSDQLRDVEVPDAGAVMAALAGSRTAEALARATPRLEAATEVLAGAAESVAGRLRSSADEYDGADRRSSSAFAGLMGALGVGRP